MRVGDTVEDFELPDQSWRLRRLSTVASIGPVVLFFYPAAFAPLCTVEHCRFRDTTEEFAKVGAQPIGISSDPVDRQAAFARKHDLGYPILSDVDGAVGRRFDVDRGIKIKYIRYRRHTYVIGPDRRILDIIRSEIRLGAHADLALEFLRNYDGRVVGRHRAPDPDDY